MHRQSLSSPSSKLHSHGIAGVKEDNVAVEDPKRKDLASSPNAAIDDGEERKSQKPQKSPSKPERIIHLIPILTVLCFLILYLSSHDPSQKDLAQFNGFKLSSKRLDSTSIDDFGRFLEIEKGNVLAIRSLRNLQEINKHGPRNRLHRKIGDF